VGRYNPGMDEKPKPYLTPANDVFLWIEQDSSIHLRAKTSFGDPVELTAGNARDVAAALVKLANQLEAMDQR
jgi:hypothetical protein